eukprot:NODE_431_length_7570_cov_0.606263.p4 type:complete len:260 gc:universal NODE_431_length_7570_cov_0.606263:72-851(+)
MLIVFLHLFAFPTLTNPPSSSKNGMIADYVVNILQDFVISGTCSFKSLGPIISMIQFLRSKRDSLVDQYQCKASSSCGQLFIKNLFNDFDYESPMVFKRTNSRLTKSTNLDRESKQNILINLNLFFRMWDIFDSTSKWNFANYIGVLLEFLSEDRVILHSKITILLTFIKQFEIIPTNIFVYKMNPLINEYGLDTDYHFVHSDVVLGLSTKHLLVSKYVHPDHYLMDKALNELKLFVGSLEVDNLTSRFYYFIKSKLGE